jgi:hypothetical protein
VVHTTETSVTLRQALKGDRVLAGSKLRRSEGLDVILKPQGLLQRLGSQQVADLVEFIRSLRGF